MAGLHGLQLVPGLIGVLQEGDHRHAPHQLPLGVDGVHVDEVKILNFLAGDVENGLAGRQHVGQTGSRPQIPESIPLNGADIPARLLAEELPVCPVAKDNVPLSVDDGNALPHGVKDQLCVFVQFHKACTPFRSTTKDSLFLPDVRCCGQYTTAV